MTSHREALMKTDRRAVEDTKEMIKDGVDLDILLGLLSDHYGIDLLVLPKNSDRLEIATLANWVNDNADHLPVPPSLAFPATFAIRASQIARFVLLIMQDHRAEVAT